ncbi:hypothetical protein ABPG74_001991 [Tetrahymena malaccensis]
MSKEDLLLSLQQLQKRQLQLEQSYIALCLKISKSHFQLKEFLKIQNNKNNSDFISNQQFGHVIVYDQVDKKCKMLIICLSMDFEKYNKFYQEVTKKCIRTDICMKIMDQYYLDTEKLYYVFEMEYFSSTLTDFKDQFKLETGVVTEIKDSLKKFYQKKVHIFYDEQLQDIQQYYVNLNDKDQLQVKFNLIDPNWKIESYLQNQLQLGQINLNSIQENTVLSQEKLENKMQCEKQKELNYQNNEILQMFQEFYFKKSIQKSNLVQVVQEKFENILIYHPIEMIEVISSHPLYDDFKVIYSDEHVFELKAKKRGQTIMLKAHGFQNLQKAEETLSIYNKILANNKISSTILGVELLIFEKQNYVLVEKTYLNYLQKQKYNFSQMEEYEFKVFNFINFSYQLFVFSGLQITKVNPLKLLLLENEFSENLYSDIQSKYLVGQQYLKKKNEYEEEFEKAKRTFLKLEKKLIEENLVFE